MLFWLIAFVLATVATLAIVFPLLGRAPRTTAARDAYDEEVYRAQLEELREDEARGAVGPQEAAASRAEIGRRLLRAHEAAEAAGPARSHNRTAVIAGLTVALLLPVGSFLFYDRWGSPEVPDQPLAMREPSGGELNIETAVAEIERRLAEEPDDAAGWSVVAPVYLQMGQGQKAATAFRNALRLNPPTAQTVAGLGEALVQAADGRVTPEAEAEFRRALTLDAGWVPARFFLALALSQQGRSAEAVDAWSELLRTGPPDGAWRPVAEAALADARSSLAAPPVPGAPGPTPDDVRAAEGLSDGDRQAMVQGMVSGLAERLKAEPHDPDGWKRLVRSYVVLDQRDQALAALSQVRAVFPAASPELMDILSFARGLGLEPDTTSP
ncbi:c-type cytochrome biogenesis protein CcmI [Aureimonas sp. SK2]|uniref:c-type cytochrome biogenesis protein CcmI n=1 Tax=Aureimonas sp. SK2 TaxID=3015992 RepID=UPI002443AAA2|nr:c-type cytochrome biogenesis protein CcmI [Aureimonas sp. SK2]